MWSIFNGYMCILLYMKPVWCNAFSKDLPAFGGWGWGVNLPWEYVNSAIYDTYLV